MENNKKFHSILLASLLAGAVGGCVWGAMGGLVGIELAKAIIVGSVSLLIAELFGSIPKQLWQRSLLFGLSGGITLATISYLFFHIGGNPYKYMLSTGLGAMVGGSLYYYWMIRLRKTESQ